MSNKKVVKEVINWSLSILAAFFIVAFLNSRVFAKVQVEQSSMESTLMPEQQLIEDKLSYNFVEPKRGDIVIFLENRIKGNFISDTLKTFDGLLSIVKNGNGEQEEESRLVKRVIGIPGDIVDIKDGYVYVNGNRLEEPYAKGTTSSGKIKFPVKVGENKLFVLGDNRLVSRDSRAFGLVDLKQVEGKAVYRVYPFNKLGKIK